MRTTSMLTILSALTLLAAACGRVDDELATATQPEAARVVDENATLDAARLTLLHDAADALTGMQLFVDGQPWDRLEMHDPDGALALSIRADGALARGIRSLSIETDAAMDDLLADLPEGDYGFIAHTTEDDTMRHARAPLAHDVPRAPVIRSPAGKQIDPQHLVVTWQPVGRSLADEPITIAGYQIVVERTAPTQERILDVRIPPYRTHVTVPAEALEDDTQYRVLVRSLTADGNAGTATTTFATPR